MFVETRWNFLRRYDGRVTNAAVLVDDLQAVEDLAFFRFFVEIIILSVFFIGAENKGGHRKVFAISARFNLDLVGRLIIVNDPIQKNTVIFDTAGKLTYNRRRRVCYGSSMISDRGVLCQQIAGEGQG